MRLGYLLGQLPPERIEALGRRVVPGSEEVPVHSLVRSIETVLRESGHVEQVIQSRRPPVMALLRELLEAPGYISCRVDVEIRTTATGDDWMRKVTSGELAGRDDSCRIYRRLLAAAWQNDLKLDPSETFLLGLLRRELGMTAAEHYLIAYHPDIQPFWRQPDNFERVLEALVANGVLFRVDDRLVLPEEFVERVRKTIGIFMARSAARRLLSELSNDDLRSALDVHSLKTSGSKDERISRIIDNLVPVPAVLDVVHIHDLRALARGAGAQVSGSKDELVWRLIDHFENDRDLEISEPEARVEPEDKELEREEFLALFLPLKGRELHRICERHGLKTSGTKETQIQTMWESHLSERSLLKTLKNSELRALCEKHELDGRGSKEDMVERLLSRASSMSAPRSGAAEESRVTPEASTEVA